MEIREKAKHSFGRVSVHRNLHKKCWSVVSRQGSDYGRVIEHTRDIVLVDTEYRVSEKGRQRVIAERTKNVHAYVVGYVAWYQASFDSSVLVSYNPYKSPNFTTDDGVVVVSAKRSHFREDGKVAVIVSSDELLLGLALNDINGGRKS